MPFALTAGRLRLIQQISQELIWKSYFHGLRHGRRKFCIIDAHVHLEKGDYSVEWIEQFVELVSEEMGAGTSSKGLYRLYRKIKTDDQNESR